MFLELTLLACHDKIYWHSVITQSFTGDAVFVNGSQITFTTDTEEGDFSRCLYILAVEDDLIELDEPVIVMIDGESLMTNDVAGSPPQVMVTIEDDDGKY